MKHLFEILDNNRARKSNSTTTFKKKRKKIALQHSVRFNHNLHKGFCPVRFSKIAAALPRIPSLYPGQTEILVVPIVVTKYNHFEIKHFQETKCFSNPMSNSNGTNLNEFFFPTNQTLFYLRAGHPYSSSLPSNSKEKNQKD